MILTVFDIIALIVVILAFIYAFFFAGQSRKPKPMQTAFLVVMAIMISFQLFENRFPIGVRAPVMLVIGAAVLTVSLLYGLEWWKSLQGDG